MRLKHFLSRQTIKHVPRFNIRRTPSWNHRNVCTTTCIAPLVHWPYTCSADSLIKTPKNSIGHSLFYRFVHSGQETVASGPASGDEADSEDSEEEDEEMNEFLSRFVWIMRGKLTEVYADADKKAIDAMLQIIVGKVVSEMEKGSLEQLVGHVAATLSEDLSEDLWKTVWEVSNVVLEDMKKVKKKEKMKSFFHSEEVKEMTRFAGGIGIRGDMLRELRFKWAQEKLEDSEFYDSLKLLRKEAEEDEEEEIEEDSQNQDSSENDSVDGEESTRVVSLPKRSGKIKYKIYGLDLSKPKWAEVADKIHESGDFIWPQEPKPISGKCKMVTEKILSLQVDDDPYPLFAEWIELLQPSRVDWIALLDRMKEQNNQSYFKVAELLLDEESFQASVIDYSKLVEAHAKHDHLDDAERILKMMNEKGILPDILTKATMVHMYSKTGNLKGAKEAFESLKSQGFQPDLKIYKSMIMASINAGELKLGDSLRREAEQKNIKVSAETYMALLRSYAQRGDPTNASRIYNSMEFAGFQPSLESCTYLVEAYGRKGEPDVARQHFDEILKLGIKPNDECIARMIAAYEKHNWLDKGLNLLLQLEKDGIKHGVATYSVLVDWLGKLQLIEEAEDLLGKIAEQGGSTNSLDIQISLCDMYSRANVEKKALQALGIIEAQKEKLKQEEFERVIDALAAGGFMEDAKRMHKLMEAQGYKTSEKMNMSLLSSLTRHRRLSTAK